MCLYGVHDHGQPALDQQITQYQAVFKVSNLAAVTLEGVVCRQPAPTSRIAMLARVTPTIPALDPGQPTSCQTGGASRLKHQPSQVKEVGKAHIAQVSNFLGVESADLTDCCCRRTFPRGVAI